jgi:D-alanyl-D-alanine carboxypeptidase
MDVRTEAVLQRTLDRLVGESAAPGATAAIRCDGLGVWVGASGSSDLEGRIEMPVAARLPIYSVAKSMIAVCAMRLSELRALAIDDPLSRWLPDLPFGNAVSLRQLLNHTAGVPDYSALPEQIAALEASPGRAWTCAQFIEHACDRGLDFNPGDRFRYSNTGYALLTRVVERANATSLAEAVQQHVAGPLGFTATAVVEGCAAFEALAPVFSSAFRPDAVLEDIRSVYDPGWVAHGLVSSTAAELCEFYQALFAGKLVQRESLDQMTQLVPVPGDHPPAVSPAYGLGLMGDLSGAYGPEFGHGGAGPGASAWAGHQPKLKQRRVSSAVICNRDGVDSASLRRALLAALAAELGETFELA